MKKINFLFAVHNHQPVGNFESVLEDNFNKAYKPFLDLLYKYDKIKFSYHISGFLLKWIEKNKKEYIDKLKEMVKRGQVEILTGGFYEPILPTIEDEDKKEQILTYTNYLEKLFNTKIKGLWLAERVWEPNLASILAKSNIEYTILDETHFISSGIKGDDLLYYYITEDQGLPLYLFPISKKLRYYIPFATIDKLFNYFKEISSEDKNKIIVMADDGEKFGSWPETFNSVYEQKWLENFLQKLSNCDYVNTLKFSEVIENLKPKGRVYIPTASYWEMSEWSLPVNTQIDFENVINKYKNDKELFNFLKGGFWRNFFAKYPESNLINKRSLSTREMLKNIKNNDKIYKKALDHIWQSQCNCAYWHGVFGGLYLPHLRSALYEQIIKAEKLIYNELYKNKPYINFQISDIDVDSFEEINLSNNYYNIILKPNYGGTIIELDIKNKEYNILNTITRRKEAYHKKIIELVKKQDNENQNKTVSIHDIARVKEKDLDKYLVYDWYERRAFIDHIFGENANLHDFAKNKYPEQGDFTINNYKYEIINQPATIKLKLFKNGHFWYGPDFLPLTIEKYITLKNNSDIIDFEIIIKNTLERELLIKYGIEFNFAFLANSNNSYIKTNDKKFNLTDFNETTIDDNLLIYDSIKDLHINFNFSNYFNKTTLWTFPVYTVSQAEDGFEKIFQEVSFTFIDNIKLDKKEIWEKHFSLQIQ